MRYSCNGSVKRLNWCRVVVSCNCHNIRDSQDWTPSNSKFHGWFLPNAINLKGEQEFGIISSFHSKFSFFFTDLFFTINVPVIHASYFHLILCSKFPSLFSLAIPVDVRAWNQMDCFQHVVEMVLMYYWWWWFHFEVIFHHQALVALKLHRVVNAFVHFLGYQWIVVRIWNEQQKWNIW